MLLKLFRHSPFVIGMVHLPPLPGAPGYGGGMPSIVEQALSDAKTLASGGVDGIMIENFGDVPFAPDRVCAETVAAMAVVASAVRSAVDLPLGINVLRNDGLSALAVAAAAGGAFIRVNILSGARLTDQGIIQGRAFELARKRKALGCDHIAILADLSVKHSRPIAPEEPLLEAEELVERSGASALVLTGSTTGRPVDTGFLNMIRDTVRAPIIIGSGVNAHSISKLSSLADGFIIGTSLKEGGDISAPVSLPCVRKLLSKIPGRK